MLISLILETDANLDLIAMDGDDYVIGNDVIAELAILTTEWANMVCPDGGHMMPGTRIRTLKGTRRKVLHIMIESNADDPLTLIQSLIAGFGFDWVVVAMVSHYAVPQYDELGEPVLEEYQRPTGDPDNPTFVPANRQKIAVDQFLPVPTEFNDWLVDEWDDSEPPISSRPIGSQNLHIYGGQSVAAWHT